MECAFVFAMLLVGLAVLVAALLSRPNIAQQWGPALAQAAERFGGVYTPPGWSRPAQIRLRHGDGQAWVTISAEAGQPTLETAVDLPGVTPEFEIAGLRSGRTDLGAAADWAAFEFDWESFRRDFLVRTDDGDELRGLLTDGVRHQLVQLLRTPERADLIVFVRAGWLTIRKRWRRGRPSDLIRFIDLSLGLRDQFLLAASAEIAFVERDEAEVLDDCRCRICGETIAQELVYCAKCKAAHHRDCWDYNRGCSTYGCGSSQFLVPGVAPRAEGEPLPSPAPRPAKPR